MEVIVNVNAQRSAVRSIAWLDLWPERHGHLNECLLVGLRRRQWDGSNLSIGHRARFETPRSERLDGSGIERTMARGMANNHLRNHAGLNLNA